MSGSFLCVCECSLNVNFSCIHITYLFFFLSGLVQECGLLFDVDCYLLCIVICCALLFVEVLAICL